MLIDGQNTNMRDRGGARDTERLPVIDVVIDTCVEHGLDPDTFVELMNQIFEISISAAAAASDSELMRFLLTTLDWTPPATTAAVERQRAQAKMKWSQIAPRQLV